MANIPQIYITSGDDIPNYGFIVPVSSTTVGTIDITTQVVSLTVETDGSITIALYVSICEMPSKALVFFRYLTFNYTLKEWIYRMFVSFDIGLMVTLSEFRTYYESHYTSKFDESMTQISNGIDSYLTHWYTVILQCLIKHYHLNK